MGRLPDPQPERRRRQRAHNSSETAIVVGSNTGVLLTPGKGIGADTHDYRRPAERRNLAIGE